MALEWHEGPHSANAIFPGPRSLDASAGWHAGPQAAAATFVRETKVAASPSSRFGDVKDFFATLQAITFTVAALLGFVAIGIALFDGVAQKKLVIDAIAVTADMEKRGFTKEVVAQRLIDAVQDMNARAKTEKPKTEAASIAASVESFVVPDAAAPIKQFVLLVRKYLNGTDQHVSGEFVCTETACTDKNLTLRVRMNAIHYLDLEPQRSLPTEKYIEYAAEKILHVVDPYIYAAYLDESGRDDEAFAVARYMYATRHVDAKWGALMMANRYAELQNLPEAEHYYDEALKRDPLFNVAHRDRGSTYVDLALSEHDGRARTDYLARAEASFQKAIQLGHCDATALDGMATVHLARMNLELADDSARQAVDCAPREATHLATLSRIRMELGDGSAKRMVEDAYSIDADDANVNFVLGVHHEKADAKLATAFFSKASELEPSREDFRRSYARNLHVTGKRGPALEAYLKLHRVWPQDAEDIVSSADLLLASGNPALACEGYDFLLAKASLDLLREDAIAQKLIWAWFPSSMPHVPPD